MSRNLAKGLCKSTYSFFLTDTQVSLQLYTIFQQLDFLLKAQNKFSKHCLNVSEWNQQEGTQIQGEKEEVAIYLHVHTFTTVVELQTSHSPVNLHLKILISQLGLHKKIHDRILHLVFFQELCTISKPAGLQTCKVECSLKKS